MKAALYFLAILFMAVPAAAGTVASSCVSCHGALDRRNSDPVRLWEKDLHREAGLGCHNCHGGDPDSLESAMDPSNGFLGSPDEKNSTSLCGGCHSETGRIPDPTVATNQMEQYLSGSHGLSRDRERPTCVTCHGSHGIKRVTDRSSPVFPTRIVQLCIRCHDKGTTEKSAGPWKYQEDVHGRALAHGTNPNAPTCIDCHGAHSAGAPGPVGIQLVCGNCHTREYEYFQAGPHGDSLRLTGLPSCTYCHGYHGIEATGINEIVGRITDQCQECHQVGTAAWGLAREIDENLGVAMSLFGSLRDMSEDFMLAGVETERWTG